MRVALFVGALIGWLAGGLVGLLVGAGLAWGALRGLPRLLRRGLAEVQRRFLESAFAVMGAVCKADGRVNEAEIRMAENLFQRFGLSGDQRRAAQTAFNRGKSPDFDLSSELAQFMAAGGRHPGLRQMFLQVQLSAVAADGRIEAAEHEILARVARGLGLGDAELERLEALLRGAGEPAGSGTARVEDAYTVLGVSPQASDAEVKRAYRRLMSENHPDKLAGKGLPESMRAVAEERTREITNAYERVQAARGRAGVRR